jgi:hypothetical protein
MDSQALKGPLGWSISSLLVILVFCMYAIFTIASPFMQGSASEDSKNKTASLVDKYEHYVAVDIARFNGRSAFFQPIRIAPPPNPKPKDPVLPPGPEEELAPPPPLGPPPAPATYMGPPLIAIIGDEAWFRGSGSGPDAVIRLKAGEEQNGLKLVTTTPPAMVIVQHRTGEYPLNLFKSEEPFFRQDAPPDPNEDFLEEVEG